MNEGGAALIDANAKTCPYCEVLVIEHSHCNCITCICSGNFCWLCGMGLGFKGDKAHSHFWQDAWLCDGFSFNDGKNRREFWRPRCAGLMAGESSEPAYIARNGPIFGVGNPAVQRGE